MARLFDQVFAKLPYPQARCDDKIVLVTGSNVGLGFEAAKHFARLGAAKLILGVRTVEKGEAAKREIEGTTGCDKAVVEVWQLDMLSYDSVKQFARRAEARLSRLDQVVLNAGIAPTAFVRAEGEESTIITNVISTFLLALLLLPKLKQTAVDYNVTPHVAVVSSAVHGWTKLPERKSASIFEALADEKTARMGERYPASKLLEVFAVREIAARYPHPRPLPVVINCLSPGLCHSSLTRDLGRAASVFMAILKWLIARPTELGSRTLVHAASAGPETHGKYLSECVVKEPAPFVTSEEGLKTQRRVWDELIAKLEKIEPSIMKSLET